jgi:hypothetical protein
MSETIFRRIGGRIIPIKRRESSPARIVRETKERVLPVRERKQFKYLGYAASVASGLAGTLSLTGGIRGFAGWTIAEHALQAGAAASAVGSFAGKGHRRERVKLVAKRTVFQEATMWGTFLGGMLLFPRGRARIKTAAGLAMKGLSFIARRS